MMLLELLVLPLSFLITRVFLRIIPLWTILDYIPVVPAFKRLVTRQVVSYCQGWKKQKSKFDVYDFSAVHDPTKNGVIIPEIEYLHEHQRNIDDPRTTDEVFFYGTNKDGGCLFIRLARRIDNFAELNIYLETDDGERFEFPRCEPLRMPESDPNIFRAGGLRLECLSPMRSWRVTFNGILRRIQKTSFNDDDIIHVRFGFIWAPLSNLLDFDTGIHPSLLASILSEKTWSEMASLAPRVAKGVDKYDQFGQLKGTLNIEDSEKELYFWGARSRSREHLSYSASVPERKEIQRIYGITKNGVYFHIGIDSSIEGYRLPYGFVVPRKGYACKIDSWQIDQFTTNGFSITMTAESKHYFLEIKERKDLISFSHNIGREGSSKIQRVELIWNGDEGHGIIISESTKALEDTVIQEVPVPKIPVQLNSRPFVVSFDEEACKDVNITGGKGASLAHLMQTSKKGNMFQVPKGIVVTSHAYRLMVNANDLSKEIRMLEDAAWRNTGNLNEVSERLVRQFGNAYLPDVIHDAVQKRLQELFGRHFESKTFAIRSSAVGEDSEDLSAAGQMDTFLGVKGSEACSMLTKCWASQFSLVAVNYKKTNGQVLDSDMAVVFQEMVDSEVAGVMFTCDPMTGDPRYFLITANYGLGESVVSASAEPDVITLHRTPDNKFSIHSVQIGKKKTRIIMHGEEGTKEEDISEEESSTSCLKDEYAIKLGVIGAQLEEIYGSPRDTEWAIAGKTVYFLQARPVTSIYNETDFEIMHEMDTANQTESDYSSRANVGEVLPGSMSYLFCGYLKRANFTFEAQTRKTNGIVDNTYYPYILRGFFTAYNQFFFNISEGFIRIVRKEEETIFDRSFMISLFGREIDDDELRETCWQRKIEESKMQSVRRFWQTLKAIYSADAVLEAANKKYWNLEIPINDCKSANEMFDKIDGQYCELLQSGEAFFACNTTTSLYNLFLLLILTSSDNDRTMSSEVYSDFATLLSSCESVESADVPASLTKLAKLIEKQPGSDVFKTMSAQEGLQWLRQSPSHELKAAFEEFLRRHGHRCLKEYDFKTITWGMDPTSVVALLQPMVGNISGSQKKEVSVQDAISQLKTPLSWTKKQLMKFLVPLSRKAVGRRERGKSMLIKSYDVFRKAYRRLAAQMVAEGFLPDEELAFFLTLDEIKTLLTSRSPRLIAKAKKRQRLFPEMDQMQFDEIIKGVIKPITKAPTLFDEQGKSSLIMKGTPVSNGVIKAKARVARNLQEASQIQKGEILITYSTDIGWSPYFPMISGIATEIGGLISHGAVIAREYGLPCVVGVHGATSVFKTGDIVILDGKKGILQKVDDALNTAGS